MDQPSLNDTHDDLLAAAEATLGQMFGERYRGLQLLGSGAGPGAASGRFPDRPRRDREDRSRATRFSSGARMRLEHDASALRQLAGTWASPLLDMAWAEDRLCLVRAFVPGESLKSRLRRGPLTLADTLTVGRCLLAALNEVHACGIVHRDVRPARIMLGAEEPLAGAVLVDCDAARLTQTDVSVDGQSLDTAQLSLARTNRLARSGSRRNGRSLFGGCGALRVSLRAPAVRGR